MARKYLKGGALNPAWCNEQDGRLMTKSIVDNLYDLFTNMDIDISLQLAEGVSVNISTKEQKESKEMCTIINTKSDYESKFNFIKNHSGTPEDLSLAREIIGLK